MQAGSNTVQALLRLITTSDDDAFAGTEINLLPSCSWRMSVCSSPCVIMLISSCVSDFLGQAAGVFLP